MWFAVAGWWPERLPLSTLAAASTSGWQLDLRRDGWNIGTPQVVVNRIIEHFGVWKFFYDSTRAELDDRYLSKHAIGKKSGKNVKAHMPLLLERRFAAEPDEPSIVLLGAKDSRQVRQISAVKRDLSAYESEDGHGDSFWSNALAVWAAEQGPTFVDLGDASQLFGRR